jgi:hypothetical protein
VLVFTGASAVDRFDRFVEHGRICRTAANPGCSPAPNALPGAAVMATLIMTAKLSDVDPIRRSGWPTSWPASPRRSRTGCIIGSVEARQILMASAA